MAFVGSGVLSASPSWSGDDSLRPAPQRPYDERVQELRNRVSGQTKRLEDATRRLQGIYDKLAFDSAYRNAMLKDLERKARVSAALEKIDSQEEPARLLAQDYRWASRSLDRLDGSRPDERGRALSDLESAITDIIDRSQTTLGVIETALADLESKHTERRH